jgi:hypothetical protein
VALREAALEAAQSQLASAEADLELCRALTEGQIERSDAVLGASRSQLAEAEKAAVDEGRDGEKPAGQSQGGRAQLTLGRIQLAETTIAQFIAVCRSVKTS